MQLNPNPKHTQQQAGHEQLMASMLCDKVAFWKMIGQTTYVLVFPEGTDANPNTRELYTHEGGHKVRQTHQLGDYYRKSTQKLLDRGWRLSFLDDHENVLNFIVQARARAMPAKKQVGNA